MKELDQALDHFAAAHSVAIAAAEVAAAERDEATAAAVIDSDQAATQGGEQ